MARKKQGIEFAAGREVVGTLKYVFITHHARLEFRMPFAETAEPAFTRTGGDRHTNLTESNALILEASPRDGIRHRAQKRGFDRCLGELQQECTVFLGYGSTAGEAATPETATLTVFGWSRWLGILEEPCEVFRRDVRLPQDRP